MGSLMERFVDPCEEPLKIWGYPGDMDDLLQEADLWKRLELMKIMTHERHQVFKIVII